MTLREQVSELGIKHVNENWFKQQWFPRAVQYLAVMAFTEGWDREAFDSRVILRACYLIDEVGWVSEEEPGVM